MEISPFRSLFRWSNRRPDKAHHVHLCIGVSILQDETVHQEDSVRHVGAWQAVRPDTHNVVDSGDIHDVVVRHEFRLTPRPKAVPHGLYGELQNIE